MRGWALVVVVVVAFAGVARAEPRQWSVTPPPGWADVSAAVSQDPEFVEIQKELGHVEVAAFQGPDERAIKTTYAIVPGEASRDELSTFERDVRSQMTGDGKEVAYRRTVDAHFIVLDMTVTSEAGTVYDRAMIGVPPGRQVVVMVTACSAEETTCRPVLDSMKLDRSRMRRLADLGSDRTSFTAAVRPFGGLAVIGLIVLLVVLRKKRRAREQAAAPT